ncbi:DUF4012 domain-containing protein [Cellulomonas triticagri]|uniref:DUF4012 domain-containing protein n=1 Tax=Cellulomonas triticagri TaxID=2483352 RepID=A0A3M2JK36_9CELL|nr:DUF4012 domain-containing protein [Cellulomonas triticagri]
MLIVLAVLLGVLLVLAGWLAVRVAQAAGALRDLQAAADGARPEVDALDVTALSARLPAAQDAAHRAADAADDPVWRAATHLPFVGDDLAAVGAVARAADALTRDAAPDLLAAAQALTGPAPSPTTTPRGWVDLTALADAAPAVSRAAAVLDGLRDDLDRHDPADLVGPVAGPVTTLRDALSGDALRSVQDLADVLPALLGADGPRTYLLLSLNPAELRAQGGIVGAVAVLQVRDGAVGLVGQRSTADLPERPASVLPLTEAEHALHGDRLGRWVQDTVLSPDFPRAAQLAAAFWTASTGQPVDGVLATDPVVVADVLAATGRTVTADGREIGGDALLAALLRDAYLGYGDPRSGDAFYAQVAAAAFGVLADALADPAAARSVLPAVADAVAERRVLAWSAVPAEQARLAASPLGGAFLSGDAPTPTGDVGGAVGVFLDDATAGKLGYDLDVAVGVTLSGCDEDVPVATVTVRLDFRPPGDVTTYPAQVLGDGSSALPPGWLATNVSFYGARDGSVGGVLRDGAAVGGPAAREARRPVVGLTSRLAPGAGEEYVLTVPAPGGALTVWSTPTLAGPGVTSASCAG